MKLIKYFIPFAILICIAVGCKKDQSFNDTSLASTAASASNLAVMFNITHDNRAYIGAERIYYLLRPYIYIFRLRQKILEYFINCFIYKKAELKRKLP